MEQDQLVPPDLERPWYYERWFLVPVFAMGWPLPFPPFVLWPVWAILILRSPWHNHVMLNGLAWDMLITGADMEYKNLQGEGGVAYAVALMVPGAVVIVITQVMWTRFRSEHGLVVQRPYPPKDSPDSPDSKPDNMENTDSRESRARRRFQRRRSSRSSRSR